MTGALEVSLHQDSPVPLGMDFAVEPGEALALVGPSGAGKSTTLRMIAGLVHPRSGRVSCNGEVWLDSGRGLRLAPQRRRAGLVFQEYALFPHLNALHNVELAVPSRSGAERLRRARGLLELVGLAGLERRRPGELSGGQRQRVALARALAREPATLLLDEPFSAVDQMTRRRLQAELIALRGRIAAPVVFVTHDLQEAVLVSDRMAVLDHGRLLQTGSPEEVMNRPASVQVARLLGRINLIEVEVFEASAGGAIVGLAGARVRLPGAAGVRAGGRAILAVRYTVPVLEPRREGSGETLLNRWDAVIETIAPAGELVQVGVLIGGSDPARLVVSLSEREAARLPLAAGARIGLGLPGDRLHLLPPG